MNTHTHQTESTCADIGRRIAAVLYSERAAALARRAAHEGASVHPLGFLVTRDTLTTPEELASMPAPSASDRIGGAE